MIEEQAKKKKLTPKQERFCQEYVVDLNATRAYRVAYPKSSAKAAESNSARTIRIDKVKACIAELQKELQKATGITAQRVIEEYAKVAFSNIKAFLDEGNSIKDLSRLADDVAAAVESIQSDIRHDGGDSEGYTEKVKLKLHSKLNALDALGKHLGIFGRDNEQKTPVAAAPVLTERELKERLARIEASGNGLDTRSIEGDQNEEGA